MSSYVAFLSERLLAGATLNDALADLRTIESNPLKALKALCQVQAISLNGAKQALAQCAAWSEEVARMNALTEEFLSTIETLQKEKT